MSSAHEQDPRWAAVDHYSFSHLHPATHPTPSATALSHALAHSKSQDLPDIAVSPSQGKFLQLQARLLHAKHILEVGTLGGYSTIWLASSSPDVRVTTVELSAYHAAVARENLSYAGVGERVEVKVGAGVDVLAGLAKEVEAGARAKWDFVFIDADKVNNWAYVDAAVGMCEAGACVIVDNVVRKGRLAEEGVEDVNVQGAREVVERVGEDARLEGVVVQTVGEKSYDGFLFVVVK